MRPTLTTIEQRGRTMRDTDSGGGVFSQAAYDRAIRQLRVCMRILSAALLAVLAHSVIDGANLADAVATALIALLLLASGALWRYGRRRQPHAGASRTVTRHPGRD
jgi:uncharacterized membrane protein YfbV (UPF0208 family)